MTWLQVRNGDEASPRTHLRYYSALPATLTTQITEPREAAATKIADVATASAGGGAARLGAASTIRDARRGAATTIRDAGLGSAASTIRDAGLGPSSAIRDAKHVARDCVAHLQVRFDLIGGQVHRFPESRKRLECIFQLDNPRF